MALDGIRHLIFHSVNTFSHVNRVRIKLTFTSKWLSISEVVFKSHIVQEIALPPSQVYHDPQQISSTQASVQTISDVQTSASLTTSGPEPVSTNNPSGMVNNHKFRTFAFI